MFDDDICLTNRCAARCAGGVPGYGLVSAQLMPVKPLLTSAWQRQADIISSVACPGNIDIVIPQASGSAGLGKASGLYRIYLEQGSAMDWIIY